MSSLMLRWLNEEMKLHRKVEVLEQDLSNGYIFAEVLHLKGLEPQFESYEDASSMAAKIRNMELLEQRFEALGMPFPMSTRRAIMMEDRSVVLQFLLQLKDFLRRPKTKVDDGKPKMNAREKPVKARVAAESKVPPRDVEERFVATTMKKFHPTEIRFDKGFDMAVHLRKFQQAQWTAENKLSDLRQQDAHAKDGESAAGYTAARAHLKDKAQFMRDWDQEHREKWKETQRTFLATERSNLRLELTLQARQQINADVRLAESQHDGTAGVVDFERNMNRLGLTFEAAEQSLRAIPANDPGPRVHLRGLELRVEDLDFRPSNNIKMMKELRKRRKAQLAAEKDRRMRRQKALALQKMVTSSRVSIERHDDHEIKDIQHPELDNQVSVSAENADTIEVEGIGDVELADDAHERYIEARQAALEEHYAQLRETGSIKREEDMKLLEELRSASRKRDQLRALDACSDAVERLILLAIAIVSPSSDNDVVDMEALQKEIFIGAVPSQSAMSEQGGQELRYGLDASVTNFLSFSEVWSTLPLQSPRTTCNLSLDIDLLAEKCKHPPVALDTCWSGPRSFVVLSVFTDDESGVELVRRVSVEHHLAFLQLDQVVDGCVQTNSDQQKLGDPAALSDRERELGAFGVKISSLRQKNAVLPDALIIEIIAKTISLFRREASALSSESGTLSSTGGCILHNFPRTVDEAKLLEKAILADIPAEESEPSKESPALEDDSETPEELATPAVVSAWDCVISISADQDLLGHAPEADNPLQASDSAPVLVNNPSSAKLLPAEAQRKLDEEQKARNDEQRACLEDYWGQTTRHVRLNRTGLHGDVVVEAIHLCIDVFTQNPHKGVPAVIECGDGVFPEQLKAQRDKRREAMNLVDRVLWMRASEEIDIADDAITKLQGILHKMDEALSLKIREPMAMIRSVVHAISALAVMAEQGLESELQNGGATSFQVLVDQATTKLKFAASLSFQERILTELEVSLGDLVDSNRVAGNDFVAVLAQDPLPQVIGAVDVIYQSLPLICSVLTEHTMEKLEVVREQLYDFVPFLKEDMRDTGREVVLLKVLPREAMNATMELGGDRAGGGAPAQIAGAEVLAILGQVASKYSFHLVDELPDQQYAMNEANVTTQEITQLLQRITMVCRFADQLKQTTGQLYANDVKRLERAVQEDHQSKDKILVQVMADIRACGHAVWPLHVRALKPESDVAARLPRAQKNAFLSIRQLGALVFACRHWETSDPIAAGVVRSAGIPNDVFVALVLEVAVHQDFPKHWKDASAVAAVTLQQCAVSGAVSWRKFVWTLLCIQFVGVPTLEDILDYLEQARRLPSVKLQRQNAQTSDGIVLSIEDFAKLQLWFERNRDGQKIQNSKHLKGLVFQLYGKQTDHEDSTATCSEHIDLLSMLLSWCVHPSCSFSVRHELEQFLPQFPRGLFRAFELLCKYSAVTSPDSCISTMFTVSGSCSSETSLLASNISDKSFAQFCSSCTADTHQFFLLQNPLQALSTT